ncbi:MAG: DNA-processing protein DprA [Pseudomonadota bacterium]
MAVAAEAFYRAAVIDALGRSRARRALAAADSPAAAYAGLDAPRQSAEALARICRQRGILLLEPENPRFPPLLRVIPDPPLLLYARGDTAALEAPAVAVVGARRCTRPGAEMASQLSAELAGRGVTVVSGLARGIDAAAHKGAVARGRTVAVLGSGVADPYPVGHRGLVEAILRNGGLLISEYPPFTPALRHHFPERNRLISGLSLGVVVVEAGERSGSSITARSALEQGREVLAVPGPVTSPASRGCHRLLRDGAALVESAADVLETLGLHDARAPAAPEGTVTPTDPDAARLLEAVAATATSLDEVVAITGMSSRAAAAGLVELELGGFVRQVPGGYIRRPSSSP